MNAELQQLISDAEKRAPHDALIRDLLTQVKASASAEHRDPLASKCHDIARAELGRAEQIQAIEDALKEGE